MPGAGHHAGAPCPRTGPPHLWRDAMNLQEKFPRALWVRLFVYLVVGHVLAAFIYLLFEVGANSQ
ncbi:hypothetical protein GCM10022384_69800 [Streptomyces marokkonensis]|uniref:Small hydrophobic protein n=1 Tax=Streptomyces marokkonensis TaxID=324855 RepID=A0ABP7SV77_9ACTN